MQIPVDLIKPHPLPPVQSSGSRLNLDFAPIEANCSPVVIRRKNFANKKKSSPELNSPEERQKTPSRPPSISLDLEREDEGKNEEEKGVQQDVEWH